MSHADSYFKKVKKLKTKYGEKDIVFNKLDNKIKDFKDSIPLI